MALRPLLALALGCAASPATAAVASASAGLKLHNMFSSGMVMQAEAPVLYGTAPPSSSITVTVDDDRAIPAHAAADGSWTVRLPPRAASDPTQRGHTVVIGCDGHGWTVELKDVLFGDVWVCSGQSNMEFSTAEAFGDDGMVGGLIAGALQPGLRLYAVQKNSSTEPLAEAVDLMYPGGWVHSTPKTVCGAEYNNDGYDPSSNTSAYCGPHCGPSTVVRSFKRATWGYFSAVCYATGQALLRDTGRPQGMIESCWGGTRIESWTPAAPDNAPASEQQRHVPVDAEEGANQPASLYNGMISVLQNFPIKGALWYP
jgi:sialate O-acetylesterase